MIARQREPGELVACRLTGSASVIFGVVEASTDDVLTLRFPAELHIHSFLVANPITRQPQVTTMPYPFFLPLPLESFGWDELASCHVLRDDDIDSRFDYARIVLADYRQNVARWNPEAVRVPVHRLETR